ncbi:fibronectin type III domain-containing protein [Myxococcus landrumensis]|uniref:Fibronectin type III domain-containing protein n=1 Tax=Myxococcus landrumensis TaxID=2813577 RepID=A0ABX7NEM6_9BACT|nr:fibronectin type III domain-containing protein [Myxococcus landrumus]QSQ17240.1 fibronectin type III domain-containing protein [Myxococcus landrumus]
MDLTNFAGINWVQSCTWSSSLDAPVGTAMLTLRAFGPPAYSLAPMNETSPANNVGGVFDPLLRVGREVRIDVKTVPRGQGPEDGAWYEVFFGRIDVVEPSGDTLAVSCRDIGGVLQDVLIWDEREYGDNTVGIAVQTVMTQILANAGLYGYFAPYTPVDPMWQLGKYKQDKVPLMDALQALAGQLGWDLRFRWREGFHFWLTLRQPEREATVPVWEVAPHDYADTLSPTTRLTDIRNGVRVIYEDKNDLDAAGLSKRKVVTEVDTASRDLYGERWAEITEATLSNIDTEVEARRLAKAFIADLAHSALEVSITVPLWWHLEVGDVLLVRGDGIHLDHDELLAVQSLEHTVGAKGSASTKLTLRGRPSTSRVRWLRRESAPGLGEPLRFLGPNAPVDLSVSNTVNGAALSFKPAPTGPKWDSFELHISATPGFTPSTATFKELTATTRFEVAGLQPGMKHYAKVLGRDANGNTGAVSAEVTLTPRYVSPLDLQPYVNVASLPPNGDFEAHNNPMVPPDTWSMDAGLWGSEVRAVSDALTGVRAVMVSGVGAIASQLMAIRGGNRYGVDLMAKGSTPPAVFAVALRWFDASQAFLDDAVIINTPSPDGHYAQFTGAAAAPPAARYVRVVITGPGSAWPGRTLTVDSVLLAPLALVVEQPTPVTPFDFAGGGGGWMNFGAPEALTRWTKGLDGWVSLEGAMKSGAIGGAAFILPPGCRPSTNERFVTASASGNARIRVEPSGAVVVEAALDNSRVHLGGCRFFARG